MPDPDPKMGNVDSDDPVTAGSQLGQVQPAAYEHRPADPAPLAHDEIVDYTAEPGGSLTATTTVR